MPSRGFQDIHLRIMGSRAGGGGCTQDKRYVRDGEICSPRESEKGEKQLLSGGVRGGSLETPSLGSGCGALLWRAGEKVNLWCCESFLWFKSVSSVFLHLFLFTTSLPVSLGEEHLSLMGDQATSKRQGEQKQTSASGLTRKEKDSPQVSVKEGES